MCVCVCVCVRVWCVFRLVFQPKHGRFLLGRWNSPRRMGSGRGSVRPALRCKSTACTAVYVAGGKKGGRVVCSRLLVVVQVAYTAYGFGAIVLPLMAKVHHACVLLLYDRPHVVPLGSRDIFSWLTGLVTLHKKMRLQFSSTFSFFSREGRGLYGERIGARLRTATCVLSALLFACCNRCSTTISPTPVRASLWPGSCHRGSFAATLAPMAIARQSGESCCLSFVDAC